MKAPGSVSLALLTALLGLLTACGAQQRAALVVATDDRLEQARESGAEEESPYEYYAARAHLADVTRHSGNRQAEAAYSSADEAVVLPR